MKAFFNFLFSILIVTFSYSQTTLYVSADNGLYAREAPSRAANIITKLNYGTKVDVVEQTNLNIDVLDKGNKISGQWVKINAYTNYNYIEGYVFNGYLTEEKLKPRFRATFENFKVTVDDLLTITTEDGEKTIEKDTVHYEVELGYSPEDKSIIIKPTIHYKKIEVFQSYQTSITIMDEGPHCGL